ncbi:MAG: phosphate/phosphite/phosphonate ABC transporter substrate-binding protein [Gammaproteobacteria bacterium]|nr:phosphate/phosphite/phosphonate ABC transporter substrate-binding protein [Gammaproteobacteria bacterium]
MHIFISRTGQIFLNNFRYQLLFIFFGLALCQPIISIAKENSNCSDASPIIFGIIPFVSAEQLVIQFSPIALYLSDHLGIPVRIETAPDFVEFARRTHEDKRYDILFTAPHFYPQASSRAGYRLIVSVDSPGMWAVIVVPRQSPIHKLDDLKGKRLATVPPAGLATLLVRKYLNDAGIDPDEDITIISTPSHDASLLSSYYGVTDASALMQPPYAAASQQVRDNMRIIARTDSTPHIPISVSPRINDSCKSEITKLLLEMSTTQKGKEILSHNSFSGFKQTKPEEYDKVRDLLAR